MLTMRTAGQADPPTTRLRLDAARFALAGGIWLGGFVALSTVAALLSVPGFVPFVDLLAPFYGPHGDSGSWSGVLIGMFWGFVAGFVHLGILAVLYNALLPGQRPPGCAAPRPRDD